MKKLLISCLTVIMTLCASYTYAQLKPKMGLSLGVRCAPVNINKDESYMDAYIDPNDSTLHFSRIDKASFLLSASMTFFPFISTSHPFNHLWQGWGLVANVSLASIGEDELSTIFNKKVEGGIGICYAFIRVPSLSLAFLYEKFNNRRLHDNYLNRENQQLKIEDDVVTDLQNHLSDNRLFKDDYLNAISIKIVYSF